MGCHTFCVWAFLHILGKESTIYILYETHDRNRLKALLILERGTVVLKGSEIRLICRIPMECIAMNEIYHVVLRVQTKNETNIYVLEA
jgi:hypothetical protein